MADQSRLAFQTAFTLEIEFWKSNPMIEKLLVRFRPKSLAKQQRATRVINDQTIDINRWVDAVEYRGFGGDLY